MSSQIIILATKNDGKFNEMKKRLKNAPFIFKSLNDFGPIPDIIENGKTFEENAYIKASLTARYLGFPAMADDSGLVVDALNGEPGIYSARYAGDQATDDDKCQKILKKLEGQSNRNASFICVLSIAVPTGPALTYEARCDGIITKTPIGRNGFGYDPIFYYPPLEKTFAQLTTDEKNAVSHRGKALIEIVNEIDKISKWLSIHLIKANPIHANPFIKPQSSNH